MEEMTQGSKVEVVSSKLGIIPEGTILTVVRRHENTFSGEVTLNVEANPKPEDRVTDFQVRPRNGKLAEVAVGRPSDLLEVE